MSVDYVPQSIVSVTAGSYTPGAFTALDFNADIINAAWGLADLKTQDYDQKLQALVGPGGWLETHPIANIIAGSINHVPFSAATVNAPAAITSLPVSYSGVVSPNVSAGSVSGPSVSSSSVVADPITAPTPTEPAIDPAAVTPNSVYADFTAQAAAIIADLAARFAAFLALHFPDESTTYAAAEAWLQDAITNTTVNSIPAGIKSAILADGEVAIASAANQATEEATTRFASMRHALPPGALSGAVRRIAQNMLDSKAALIRTVAIKDFELAEQKIRTAVQLALSNRAAAMSATRDYILAIVAGYDTGNKITIGGFNAETSMVSAAAAYFNARTNAAELAYKAIASDAQLTLDADKTSAQLALDADKATATLGLEANITTVKADLEANSVSAKLGLDASSQNAKLAFDASSTEAKLAFEVDSQNAKLGLDAATTSAKLGLDADVADGRLTFDSLNATAQIALNAATKNQEKDLREVENMLKVFLSDAQILAQQGVALLNNIRAGASSSYTVNGT